MKKVKNSPCMYYTDSSLKFYIYTVRCIESDLHINNGDIVYTPPRDVLPILLANQRYIGTIATYSCISGYQLVGGSSVRACVPAEGQIATWNGTEPSCTGGKRLSACACIVLPIIM